MQTNQPCNRSGMPSPRTTEKRGERERLSREPSKLDQLAITAGEIVSRLDPVDPTKSWAQNCANEAEMVRLLAPIENEAPKHQAATPRAALFQLLLAAADLGELCGTADWDEDDLRDRHMRIEACVVSAINLLETELKLDRNDVGGVHLCNRNYTPQAWQHNR